MTMTLPEMEVMLRAHEERLDTVGGRELQRHVRIGRDTGGGGILGVALVRPTPVVDLDGRKVSITFLARPSETSIVPNNNSVMAWCGPLGFTARDFLMFEWTVTPLPAFPYTLPVSDSINALPVFSIGGETVIWWMPPAEVLPDNVQDLPHSDAFLDLGPGVVQFGEDPP